MLKLHKLDFRPSDSKIDPGNLDFKCSLKEVNNETLAQNVSKTLFKVNQTVLLSIYVKTTVRKIKKRKKH